jgi:Pyruvate/2-oxoacid:ferredoxin oxidoreductase delta subunit
MASEGAIVISRGFGKGDGEREFEDAAAAFIRDRGFRVVLVPHVYFLRSGDAAAARLRRVGDRAAFASWLYPRAAEWTVRFLLSGGRDRTGASAGSPLPSEWTFLRMADFRTAAELGAALIEASGAGPVKDASVEEEAGEPLPERWYPVIDRSLCVSCGKCLDFCLFGVYARDGDAILVENPDSCKPGCPACARICSRKAIIFPHCPEPDIAGAPAVAAADGSVRIPAAETKAGRGGNAGAGAVEEGGGKREGAGGGSPAGRQRGVRDDLDDLIEKLDKLDG